ncbi:hypothetical protein [Glaciihabitans sp. UYNi722]|uniref:hypothetical protein n=1 Tax=Glaciihabitans sp. UYNi722 TaxID=3156344 RepID=UPI003398D24B
MPVITVTIAANSGVDRVQLLAALNIAAATALGLAPSEVHSVLLESVAASTGQAAITPWPIAIMHGRRRDESAMTAAVDGVANVLAQYLGCSTSETWVQWVAA